MYGTGATLYGTTNLTNWDKGTQFTIKPMVTGLEETAALDLISPPSGAPLISGLTPSSAQAGGAAFILAPELTVRGLSPLKLNSARLAPEWKSAFAFTSTTSLDYAELNPNIIVRAGNFTDADRPNDSHVAFSTDNGANWFQGSEPGGVNSGGTVAAATSRGQL